MNEKNIVVHSYIAALEGVMSKLKERKPELGRKHIIIVPDRCTLTAERMLCASEGGSFDAFVTTWNRLFSENAPKIGYLSRQGSIMIVRNILDDRSRELKCYNKSRTSRGFAEKLYEAINQLAGCDITPDEVKLEKGSARAEDIATVYREYLRRTEGTYADAAGRMRLLREYLENSDYLRGATVYIACFDSYTGQMMNIMDVIRRKADALYVFDALPENYSFGDVETYAASSPVFAAKAIAAKIADEARRGTPYGEMCVVTAETDPAELKRIFGENGIPYSAPSSLRLSDHPLGRFISLVLSLPVRGYRAEDVVRLTKNPFCGVSKSDSDAFERYVGEFGITYKLFLSPFTVNADADPRSTDGRIYAGAERARQKVERLVASASREEFSFDGLRRILDYALERYDGDVKEADEARADPFAKMRGLIDLSETLMKGASAGIVLDALADGMTTTELAARPKVRGTVEIGAERDFRGRRFSRIFVADFDGDTHPIKTTDNGLLSDDDIAEMRASGTPLSPTTEEVNKRAQTEFYLLLESAEKITLVHSDKEGSALGFVKSRARSFREGGTEQDRFELATSHDPEVFARLCPTENMLTEEYLSMREQVEANIEIPYFYGVAKSALGDKADAYALPAFPTTVEEAGELMLSSTTKISQLETYFACPMRHFFAYGLKLGEIRTADMNAADVGNILHAVAEKYVGVMEEEEAEAAAKRLLAEEVAAAGKDNTERNRRLINALTAEAVGMCKAIRRQIEAGSFRPVATELDFGDGERAGAELNVNGKTITLRGRVDRVDISGNLARVIDYKTGPTKFDLTKLKCGVQIQLPVYLAVMMLGGYRGAGAFYFRTGSDFGEEKPYALDGLCAHEPDVLTAMDAEILNKQDSEVLRPEQIFVREDKVTREADVARLTKYALDVAAKGAEEIMSGYIAPNPVLVKGFTPCAYCEYAAVCGYDGKKREIRTAVLRKKEGVL